ncbi:mechanosensitive ion channel family protein [Ktedonospora formicarum]|uniref:Mechanosensitive ion channel MscS domain-containing protein n=1 Tax=Ktedonospora formicarum TaxID=2778364 RepID=A0A8J3MUC7_9CHLR|nr:mechanosensitive ion channel domain-containing protein [Ktedonospora formicarum]GHO45275.1 hypothetical protein KSX_34380 [Ktedonospora formicarum]
MPWIQEFDYSTWLLSMIQPAIRVAIIVVAILIAIFIGLQLRLKLLVRLKRTVLDAWIIHTLGALMLVPPLVIVSIVIPAIYDWDFGSLKIWYTEFLAVLHIKPENLPDVFFSLFWTALVVTLGLGAARTIRDLIMRSLGENRIDINIRTLIGRIFYLITIVIVFFVLLSIWNIPITAPLTILGALTVAITVSIQDIVKNLFSGIYLLVERPFYIGNIITTNSIGVNYTGRVEDIQLRATKLRQLSGEEVMIPNAYLFNNVVVNSSYYGERRATINVTIPQEQFVKDETPGLIVNKLKEVDTIIPKPEPQVHFSGFAAQKITLTVRFWITIEHTDTITDVMFALYHALPEAELTVTETAGNI